MISTREKKYQSKKLCINSLRNPQKENDPLERRGGDDWIMVGEHDLKKMSVGDRRKIARL
jgi:hypothetical protein